ncbi:hypothetical protein, partial [Pseudomonas solani]|uniref:hypothetical protein n=1 Tax=Pseudomonas solani TaxID=2731552 RepID=UPI003C2D06A4
WKLEAGSWKLEAGSWKLEAGSWKLEEPGGSADIVNAWAYLFPHPARSPGFSPGQRRIKAW